MGAKNFQDPVKVAALSEKSYGGRCSVEAVLAYTVNH